MTKVILNVVNYLNTLAFKYLQLYYNEWNGIKWIRTFNNTSNIAKAQVL